MIPDDPELRRALEARSGSLPPHFNARLGAALRGGRPKPNLTPIVAAFVVVAVSAASIGLLVYARHAARPTAGFASGPRLASPSPSPIEMPTNVELSVPSGDVVWAVVADSRIFLSNDGGDHWDERSLRQDTGPQSISFVDAQEGWLLARGSPETQCNGELAGLWHTSDGARTWHEVVTRGIAYAQCKWGVSFVDSQHGFITAWDPNHRPTIYHTSDAGATWSGAVLPDPPGFVTEGGGFTLQAGAVSRFGTVLLVSAWGMQDGADNPSGYIFRSTDGGATWRYAARVPAPPEDVAFVTESRWVQVIEPGQSRETTDAGRTWHMFASDYGQAAPVSPQVVFGDALVGYATVRGSIQRTEDGGLHWTYIKTPGVVQPG
jgi:photosystem II stability/assembly factor-like uncharacterized protein